MGQTVVYKNPQTGKYYLVTRMRAGICFIYRSLANSSNTCIKSYVSEKIKINLNIALLTAAGSGNRMGQDIPKQFMTIDNKPVIIYTMQAFQSHPEIDAIAVVCLHGWEVVLQSYANQYNITKLRWIFPGGDTNQGSIYNGITGLRDAGCSDDDIVLVQDGVRPLVSKEIISNNISTCMKYGYAVTGLLCKEAIMELTEDCLTCIDIPRNDLLEPKHHTHIGWVICWRRMQKQKKGITNTVASCTLVALTEWQNNI